MQLTNVYPSLHHKNVVITGGGSGIGAVMVEHFVRQGSHVRFCDIDGDSSEKLVGDLADEQGTVAFTPVDVTDITALQKFIKTAGEQWGNIDVLVNNAARDDRHSLDEITPDYWDERININLRPHVFAIQTAKDYMNQQGGSIINMGSVGWMRRKSGMVGYTTAKGAIHALTRTLATELGGDNIRVNSVAPGAILTQRQQEKWLTPELEKEFMDNQALKFRVLPEDVVAMILFLGADDSRACSGQNFIVDAGIV